MDGAVTRLARTLMYRCLFPEAAPLLRPAEATLLDAGVELCAAARREAKEETREKETSAEDDLEDASFAARFGLRIADVRVTEAHLAPACATPATRRAAFARLAAPRAPRREDFATAGDFGAKALDVRRTAADGGCWRRRAARRSWTPSRLCINRARSTPTSRRLRDFAASRRAPRTAMSG